MSVEELKTTSNFFLTDRSHHKMAKENVKTFFGTILCQNFENQGFLVQIYLLNKFLLKRILFSVFLFKVTFMFCLVPFFGTHGYVKLCFT